MAIVETPVLDRFGVDTVEMGRGFCLDAADWQDWVLPDGTPCKVPVYLANLEKWLPTVAPFIDIILFGDDLGSQNAPLLSSTMYREYYKPYHRKLWGRAKELAPHVKVLLHSCGAIEPLLDDLIDAGLDAVNPVQISCTGMDATTLKQKHAGQLTFWGGGCDTQEILPTGTPDQIRRHVRKQCSILNPGGGFVFQQVHNILADVPPQSIIAMFDSQIC